MVEGARLESVYTVKRIEGSNPSLSASNIGEAGLDRTLDPARRQSVRGFSFPAAKRLVASHVPFYRRSRRFHPVPHERH